MLQELVCGVWLALGAYIFWYIVKAKDFQPLSLDSLALTWKLHKHQTGCKSSCIHDLLVRNDEVVGFKCSCGYEFLQRRLITQRPIIAPLPARLESFEDTGRMVKNVGLAYKNIKKI